MARKISTEEVLRTVLDSDEEEWSDSGPIEEGSDDEFFFDSE